jgi:hypothetical protein
MLVRVKKFEEQKVTFVDQDQERYIFLNTKTSNQDLPNATASSFLEILLFYLFFAQRSRKAFKFVF